MIAINPILFLSVPGGLMALGQMIGAILFLIWVVIHFWISHKDKLLFIFNFWWLRKRRDELTTRLERAERKLHERRHTVERDH